MHRCLSLVTCFKPDAGGLVHVESLALHCNHCQNEKLAAQVHLVRHHGLARLQDACCDPAVDGNEQEAQHQACNERVAHLQAKSGRG